jgi:hypothetical protein
MNKEMYIKEEIKILNQRQKDLRKELLLILDLLDELENQST